MYDRGKLYTYVLVQQSGSANSMVATYSCVYVVDHPELFTCMACMSREIAVCTTGTGHAAADFCAAVILCSRSQWCSKFVLGQTVTRAVVEEATAATNSGPPDKPLSISPADRHWLKNLPWKIFSACMKFGGSQRRDAETQSGQTDRHTDRHRHTCNFA